MGPNLASTLEDCSANKVLVTGAAQTPESIQIRIPFHAKNAIKRPTKNRSVERAADDTSFAKEV
jgi:hypothetical protein